VENGGESNRDSRIANKVLAFNNLGASAKASIRFIHAEATLCLGGAQAAPALLSVVIGQSAAQVLDESFRSGWRYVG
jgi:hypothetical protein